MDSPTVTLVTLRAKLHRLHRELVAQGDSKAAGMLLEVIEEAREMQQEPSLKPIATNCSERAELQSSCQQVPCTALVAGFSRSRCSLSLCIGRFLPSCRPSWPCCRPRCPSCGPICSRAVRRCRCATSMLDSPDSFVNQLSFSTPCPSGFTVGCSGRNPCRSDRGHHAGPGGRRVERVECERSLELDGVAAIVQWRRVPLGED